MMINHKLQITPSLNGYEVVIKDITGFEPGGYSSTTLNVNNVIAVLLHLKNSHGQLVNFRRLEGTAKNSFMTGLSEVTLSNSDFSPKNGWVEFEPDEYMVEAYLITNEAEVKGFANYSEVTGTGFNTLVKDDFIVDEEYVYTVLSVVASGQAIQVSEPLKRFFSQAGFGYNYSHKFLNYNKALRILTKLSLLNTGTLQKEGEFKDYAVLSGHLGVLLYNTDTETSMLPVIREVKVLTKYFQNKYFRW